MAKRVEGGRAANGADPVRRAGRPTSTLLRREVANVRKGPAPTPAIRHPGTKPVVRGVVGQTVQGQQSTVQTCLANAQLNHGEYYSRISLGFITAGVQLQCMAFDLCAAMMAMLICPTPVRQVRSPAALPAPARIPGRLPGASHCRWPRGGRRVPLPSTRTASA